MRQNGTPYYYGKGSGQRAFSGPHKVPIPERSRILLQYWASEIDAFEMEKFYIQLFGRKDIGTGILRNFADGGEGGFSGAIVSEEHKEKLRRLFTGIPKSAETRRKLSEANLGKKHSEESCRKMSEQRKGNQYRLGIPHTAESRKKISDGLKAQTPEMLKKRAQSTKAALTPEVCKKISEAMKRVRAKRFWSSTKKLGGV
jgi:hypothetical protein